MSEFLERLLAPVWRCLLVVDRWLVRFLQPLWRPFQQIWNTVKPTRFSAFTILVGGILLTLTAQGQELAVRVGDDGGWLSWAMMVLLFAVGWLAFQAWYWARISLYFVRGLDRAKHTWWDNWAPRLYAAVAFTAAAYSLFQVPLYGHAILTVTVGIVFVVFLRLRAPITRMLAPIAPALAALRNVASGSKDSQAPESLGELPRSSKVMLIASVLFSIVTLCAVIAFPVAVGQGFGPAAIAFLAFAHIIPVGSLAVIRTRSAGFPIIATFLIVAVVISPFTDNHRVPIAVDDGAPDFADRPTVAAAVASWLRATEGIPASEALPVVFIATAGGGLRAAYWTATVLGELQDRCPAFARHVFSISGVSGGSVGASLFAAALSAGLDPEPSATCDAPDTAGQVKALLQAVLERDFLGPTVAAMLYPDLVQRFIPFGFLPDRGNALAGAWTQAWLETCAMHPVCDSEAATLSQPFMKLAGIPQGVGPWRPLLLLNGTHQETGKRLIVSNVEIAAETFLDAFDLHHFLDHDVSMAIAALNSARFTYVSPAGRLVNADGRDMGHVLDGGYFENYGAVTNAEIMRAALKAFERQRVAIRPIVIQISSDPDLTDRDFPGPRDGFLDFGSYAGEEAQFFLNEAAGPIRGLLRTRTARGVLANKTVSDVAKSLIDEPHRFPTVVRPEFAHFRICPVDGNKAPLGWAMSKRTRDNLNGLIEDECGKSDNPTALSRVLEALRSPLPVDCSTDEEEILRCSVVK